MIRLYTWIILFTLGVFAQEPMYRSVSSTLKECYENKYLLEKDNRLPHTLNTLIAILRKIEKSESSRDLRTLTVGIMHRFRQDGIEKNPKVIEQSGVLPFRAAGQAQKYVVITRFIPEKTDLIRWDDILTDIERCTLHFMLSSSIEIFERGDESTVCRYTDNAYRSARSVIYSNGTYSNTNLDMHDDVETLTPEQINVITNNKNGVTEHEFYPNAFYPELPPNHPKIARYSDLPSLSKCPVENGVIKTKSGPVSAGPLIAGIAAGLQPEYVKLSDVFPEEKNKERTANLSKLLLDNKWIATIAGDLAEVTLMQRPINEKISIGVNGMWNSSAIPRWYFLKSNQKLQFTTAEIRGDIDGLILASEIEALYSKVPTLRLSQILDQYYSSRGLFNSSIRACDRKTLFQTIPKSIMSTQAYTASLVLEKYLHRATIDDDKMQEFAAQATDELSRYVGEMNKDLTICQSEMENFNDVIQVAIDLTIILDTTWPFKAIQPIIADILDNIKINQYNSQFTVMNGRDGGIMINTTNSILDITSSFNTTHYTNVTNTGFDLPKSLDKLRILQTKKLNDERNGLGQAKSDVVLIIPYTSSLSSSDKEYCIEQIKQMREKVPDATLLILTYGSVDKWADLVSDISNDLFSTTAVGDIGGSATIAKLVSRIKQVPQRLINTQCGADYSSVGSTNSFIDYIEPATVVLYRLHPNYFFSTDSSHVSRIKIKGSGWGNLRVCTSRRLININMTSSLSCESINNDVHTVEFSCGDAGLIHLCDPLYLTIIANSSVTNYQCTKPVCKFAHMIEYTISYENLVCENSASINILNIFVLIISVIYVVL